MKKRTLYVTDLDGTLLNPTGEVSENSLEILKEQIKQGTLFSIATARNLQAAKKLINEIPLNIPIILNNGISFYDFNKQQYLKINEFPILILGELIEIFEQCRCYGFMYALKDGDIHFIYKTLEHPSDQEYFDERHLLYKNRCHQYDDFTQVLKDGYTILYFVLYGSLDRIQKVEKYIINVPELNCVLNKNVYKENYFLDIFSAKASKGIGIQELKQMVGADEVVAFGDNFNDVEMLKSADRSYVPENGIPEAKAVATNVIDSYSQDGVAKFIKKDVERNALNYIGSFLSHRHYDHLTTETLKKQFGTPRADVVLVFGNSIPYTAELAAKLYNDGLCKKILFSGGVGHSTSLLRENAKLKYSLPNIEDKSEAFILAEIAKRYGNVPSEDILIEEESSNSGENASFSLKILEKQNISYNNVILIQDPLLQLRSFATIQHYLLGRKMNILSFSPFVPYLNEDFKFNSSNEICGLWTLERYIQLIIGEIPRLRNDEQGYGPCGKGYIMHIDIPKEIEKDYSLILKSFSALANRTLD